MSLEDCNINKTKLCPTLIIIPDITGFNDYMNNSNLEYSQKAIGGLLESILDNNILNLKVSDIEGDTILFYSYDLNKTIDQIIYQCELMFQKFHDKLKAFNSENCKCGTCERLHNLTLKFVVHFGNLSSLMLKDYCRLFGKDLIVAQRLLKNSIGFREYILVTDNALINYKRERKISMINSSWQVGKESVTDVGEINFLYKQLEIT